MESTLSILTTESLGFILVFMMRTTQTVLDRKMLNDRGEWQSVGSIVAEMQRDGTPQVLIDRWLQGLCWSWLERVAA
jgi:hypothetical protein